MLGLYLDDRKRMETTIVKQSYIWVILGLYPGIHVDLSHQTLAWKKGVDGFTFTRHSQIVFKAGNS